MAPDRPPRRIALRREGVELSCLDFGGDGPAALLLHGLAGHAGEWRETASWLRRTHRVLAFDERGHGHSTTIPAEVSLEARTADAAFVIEQLTDGPVALVGQSLGGHLALVLAARRPELLGAVVVVEAHPSGDPDGAAAASIERWLASWPSPFPSREAAVAFFGGPGLRAEAWVEGLREDGDGLRARFEPEVLVRMLREALAVDRWAEWESIRAPALVVIGETGYFEEKEMRKMASSHSASRADFARIDGAGHELHLQASGRWREALSGFLAKLD